MRIALTALTADGLRDVVVSGEDAATVGEVAAALRAACPSGLAPVLRLPRRDTPTRRRPGGPLPPAVTLYLDGRPLDPDAPARQALRDGALVACERSLAAATALTEPTGLVEVRVSGGPAAGAVHRLGFGTVEIGSGPDCAVRIDDPAVPPLLAHLTAGPGGVTLEPVAGPAPTLDGQAVTGPTRWPYDGVLRTGASVLTLRAPEPPDAHLTPLDDGGLAYNRPPRLRPPRRPRRLEVPVAPRPEEKARLQLLAAALPAVLGIILAQVLHQWYYLLMALLSPLVIIGQWVSDRRYGRKRHRAQMKEYRRRRAEFEAELARACAADQAERRAQSPDPAEVLLAATGPRRRLWERRRADPDALCLRVGLADLPAQVELVAGRGAGSDTEIPAPPRCHAVPVTLALPDLGVVGLAGDRARSRALARWLIGQAAVLHSPRDLSVVVLSADPAAAVHWNWTRWLPHVTPRDGEECLALVGADPQAAARRVAELTARINERRDSAPASAFGGFGAAAAEPPGRVLVVLDGARLLRGLPGMPQVLKQGPAAGVYVLAIDDDQRLLPEECATVIGWDWDDPTRLRLRGAGLDLLGPVLADQVGAAWCDRVARALAPIRDVSREDADAAIPAGTRLLDLLAMPDPTPQAIARTWQQGPTTRVPVGVGAQGAFVVDLRADGPHGLVAGTTGAGKSELLQTLIASLAVANPPDAMTFVLIDYKGGSAFADCAKLPHTVGMVTDLDGHLTERALASLAAELRRREEILARAGAKDIEDYQDLAEPGLPALPRLVLVIDEFAALVAELPDFVAGLVDIGRRGRSLGVHLILATQRPAGVVTPDIRANTNLRVALRVTDAGESADVIEAPDAARISRLTPGRCFVKVGAEPPVPMQSARIGGRRPRAAGSPATALPRVVPLAFADLGRPLPAPPVVEDDDTPLTDLAVLVEAVRGAAAQLRLPTQPSPWLPPLPDVVTLDDLDDPGVLGAGDMPKGRSAAPAVPPLVFGLSDVPSQQRRALACFDVEGAGHLVIPGAPRSGRSTALRAIAAAVGRHADPRDVHLYAVDCGNNALAPLVLLPHTGAVVTRDQPDRLGRLTDRLLREVAHRQQYLAERGFADVREQRAAVAAEERLPYLLVLLDRFEGFLSAFDSYDGGRLVDQWYQLLQEGAGVGVKVVVSGDRSALIGRIATLVDDRLVLRLTDPSDFSAIGMRPRDVPAHLPPGRGFRAEGPRETQVALLTRDPGGTAQVAALQEIARAATGRSGTLPPRLRPFRVDPLPPRIDLAAALRLAERPPGESAVVVGVGGDTLGVRGFDADEHGPGILVAGPRRSGRSTALRAMVTSMLDRDWRVAVVTPRRSPLRDLAGRPGVLGVFDLDADPDDIRRALDARGAARRALVVDDLELLGADGKLADLVSDYVAAFRDRGDLVLAAGGVDDLDGMYRGPVVAIKKSRCGLLLAPSQQSHGDLLGLRLPRSVTGGAGPAGRGVLATGGGWEPVQVAWPA